MKKTQYGLNVKNFRKSERTYVDNIDASKGGYVHKLSAEDAAWLSDFNLHYYKNGDLSSATKEEHLEVYRDEYRRKNDIMNVCKSKVLNTRLSENSEDDREDYDTIEASTWNEDTYVELMDTRLGLKEPSTKRKYTKKLK